MFICFNKPEPGISSKNIYNFLLNIFRCCEIGSEVYGTIYKWKNASFTTDLRGIVEERQLQHTLFAGWQLDEASGETSSRYDGIIKSFLDASGGLYFHDSDGMMNHNKVILFEQVNIEQLKQSANFIHDEAYNGRVGHISHCIYISTANVGEDSKHNTSILVPITNDIYQKVKQYLTKVRAGYRGENVSHEYVTYEWYDKFKLYLYPRSSGQDTLVGVLENLKHYDNKSSAYCRVGIVTPRWTSGRLNLAKAATRLHKNGAIVDIITRSVQQEEMSPVIYDELKYNIYSLLFRSKGKVSSLSYENHEAGVNIHTKMLFVEGMYKNGNSHTYQKNVWIGSPNLTGSAVESHWETLLKISNHLAFKDFHTNFNFLQSERSRLDTYYRMAKQMGITL